MKISSSNDEKFIASVLTICSSSFYDQSLNNTEAISSLAKKFAKYAQFYYVHISKYICGFCSFYANDVVSREAYLSMIIINHEYQGKGIGSFLLNNCISSCKNEGMASLLLEVNKNNRKAIIFYEKKGFIILSERCNTFLMHLELE